MNTPSHYTGQIAIVDDDLDLLQSTQEYLQAKGYRVWIADSAEAFYKAFAAFPAQTVVLDIGLPSEDGLSVARLLSRNPDVAILLLSARDTVDDRLAGLAAGADRYLVKPIDLRELCANIDAIHARRYAGPAASIAPTTPTAAWRLDARDWRLTAPSGKAMVLTSHEFAVLRCLVAAQGKTVAKRELLQALFRSRVPNADERLNVLLSRLRGKAQRELGSPLPIKTVRLSGYVFTEDCFGSGTPA